MSDDLVKLYSGRILELAADIPHLGHLPAPQGSARRRSPLCGSTVTAEVVMKDGRVAEFAQDVKACALGQAAAAVVGASAIGRSHSGAKAPVICRFTRAGFARGPSRLKMVRVPSSTRGPAAWRIEA